MTWKKFDSQTKHLEHSQNGKTNKTHRQKPDESSWSKDKTNMLHYHNPAKSKLIPDYLISSDNKEEDKRVSEAITKGIYLI